LAPAGPVACYGTSAFARWWCRAQPSRSSCRLPCAFIS